MSGKTRYFYPSRLSALQRATVVPYFAIGAILNPKRGDFVAGLGDSTSLPSLKMLKSSLMSTSSGRRLLKEKPIINSREVNLDVLKTYSDNTLGRKYYEFMSGHDFSSDERSAVRFIEDPDLAYIMARYRQVHDFWHVLLDLPISVVGELALKRFEWYITGFPVGLLSSTAGQLILTSKDREVLHNSLFPWAYRCALNSKDVLSFRYEEHLSMSVDEVRKLLNLEKAPIIK